MNIEPIQLLRKLGRELRPSDPCRPEVVHDASSRIAFAVPPPLIAYAMALGRADDINAAYQHVLHPEEWYRVGNYLVFAEENQTAAVWGILPDSADPEVWQSAGTEDSGSFSEEVPLSKFLSFLVIMQVAMGGALGRVGIAPLDETQAGRLREETDLVATVGGLDARIGKGFAVCIGPWDSELTAFAGAKDSSVLVQVGDDLGIEWEYVD